MTKVKHMDAQVAEANEDLLLWGGVYLALANGEFHADEKRQLAIIATPQKVAAVLQDGVPDADTCLARFTDCVENLPRRPRAAEVYRLFDALLQIVAADGEIDREELDAFAVLAGKLGFNRGSCEMVIKNYLAQWKDKHKLSI